MRSIILVTAAALALAGCQPSDRAEEGAESPAVEQSEQAQSPEAFVRALFASYSDGAGSTGPQDQWSAATQALLDADSEAAQGVGYMGADPICDCQDWQNLQLTSVTVTPTGADAADAAVVFVNGAGMGGKPVAETLKLVREDGAWKVDDIVYGQGHSLAGEPPLKQGVAASTAALKAEGGA